MLWVKGWVIINKNSSNFIFSEFLDFLSWRYVLSFDIETEEEPINSSGHISVMNAKTVSVIERTYANFSMARCLFKECTCSNKRSQSPVVNLRQFLRPQRTSAFYCYVCPSFIHHFESSFQQTFLLLRSSLIIVRVRNTLEYRKSFGLCDFKKRCYMPKEYWVSEANSVAFFFLSFSLPSWIAFSIIALVSAKWSRKNVMLTTSFSKLVCCVCYRLR